MNTAPQSSKAQSNDPIDENFFEKIVFFFQNVFLGKGDAKYERKKQLKSIQKKIKSLEIKIFNVNSDSVTPQFAEILYQIYRYMHPLRTIINLNQDKLTRVRFENFFVETYYNEAQQELLSLLGSDHLINSLSGMSMKDLDQSINDNFQKLQKSLSKEMIQKIDQTFTCLSDMNDIVQFDLYPILKKFAPALIENVITDPPKFREVDGKHIVDLLKDLSDILYSVDFKANYVDMFSLLGKFKGGPILPVKELKQFISNLEELIDRNYLPLMISYIQRDPYYRPIQNQKTIYLTQIYFKNMGYSIKKIRDELFEKLKTNKIAQTLDELFGTVNISTLAFYTDTYKEQFIHVAVDHYLYTKPLNYLKYFLMEKYNHYIRDNLNTIAVGGDFLDDRYKTSFLTAYYSCNDIMKEIMALDDSLDDEGQLNKKIKSLLKTASHHVGTAALDTKILSGLVSSVNERALDILLRVLDYFEAITTTLKGIVEDYKASTKHIVSNVKTIGGASNKGTMDVSVKSYNEMAKFLALLKFLVPKPTEERNSPQGDRG